METKPAFNIDGFLEEVRLTAGLTDELEASIRAGIDFFNNAQTYIATCTFKEYVVYIEITVAVVDGETFKGKGGGVGIANAQSIGLISTDDANTLYTATKSFMLVSNKEGVAINFYDSHHKVIGSFLGAAVHSDGSCFGGKGTWKNA